MPTVPESDRRQVDLADSITMRALRSTFNVRWRRAMLAHLRSAALPRRTHVGITLPAPPGHGVAGHIGLTSYRLNPVGSSYSPAVLPYQKAENVGILGKRGVVRLCLLAKDTTIYATTIGTCFLRWLNRPHMKHRMKANEILESCLYVDNLQAACHFYGNVLGLELVERHEPRHLFWRCGNRMLLLFVADECDDSESKVPRHGAHGVGHLAFAVPDADIPRWREHLEAHDVVIEKTVGWPQGGHSLYFRDPAGNSLELASPKIWGIAEHLSIPGHDK